MGRQYIWRHRGWWGVNTYGVIVGGGGHCVWRHSGWWGVNTCGVIGGGGTSIHVAS